METEILALMIPITAIVLSLSIPIVYVVADYRKRRRLIELYHAERMAAIERGMELPSLPLEILGPAPNRRRGSALLPGLIWLFVGVAIVASLGALVDKEGVELLGLIPAGIGVAYLIYYFVEGRKPLEGGADAPQGGLPGDPREPQK